MRRKLHVGLWVGGALLLGGWLLAACRTATEAEEAGPRLVVSDTLTLRPLFRLGDTPALLFGTVHGVVFDSRGRLWVADGRAARLYVFGPDGTLLQQLGRRGEGPGEFQRIGGIARGVNDSIYVWDWQLQRLSVFSPEGAFVRSFSATFGSWPLRGLAEGILLGYSAPFVAGEPASYQNRRQIVQLLHFDGSRQIDTLLTLPDAEFVVVRTTNAVSVMAAPFGREPVIRVDALGRIWYGQTDRLELFRYDWRRGETQRIVRYAVDPVPVARAERDSLWQRRRILREANYRFPEHKPAFTNFVVNDAGTRIWVALSRPYRARTTSWVVFEETGRPLGVVPLPADEPILAVSDARLATLNWAEQVVTMYEIPAALR